MKKAKQLQTLLAFIGAIIFIAGCSKDKDPVDTEYPTVDLAASAAFPKQCSELKRGQTATITIPVADNAELGSANIDIHENFDHHNHGTEVTECELEAVKTPVEPYELNENIPIPAGNKSYTVTKEIKIPADADTGDYHFLVKVTDKEGWQTTKGLSIKIK